MSQSSAVRSAGGIPRRRTVLLLALAFTIAAPAGVLRALCAGRSCDRPATSGASVPFCSLPDGIRTRLAAGFRESRSPDILGVTFKDAVKGGGGQASIWPSIEGGHDRIPIVFAGVGVSDAPIPRGTGLDDVAPSVAEIMGIERPHPEVRSGRELERVTTDERPRLVLEVVWKGVGSENLEATRGKWPYLSHLMNDGSATTEASVGSLPLDPAATLTTLGTGGLPRQHGITGAVVRSDLGEVVPAWGPAAPPSVIATLADDVDKKLGNRSRIGVVTPEESDQGVIGGPWYVGADRDDFRLRTGTANAAAASVELLQGGYGSDATPDLLAVVLEGRIRAMDQSLRKVVAAATLAARGSLTVVVTATGPRGGERLISANRIEDAIETSVPGRSPVMDAVVAGGLFLDQQVLASRKLPQEKLVGALLGMRAAGERVFADAFPKIAVTFARYC